MSTFVRTEGPFGARMMLVGEAPGEEEDRLGLPFRGPAGKKLDQLLSQAGISRFECLIANVARERPPGNKIAYYFEDKNCTKPRPNLQGWINLLATEIKKNDPNVIVALGATALWALTGEKGIKEFSGYILPCTLVPGKKVLATYHPQAVGYDQRLFWPVVMDLRKALRHSFFPKFSEDKRELMAGVTFKQFSHYLDDLINDETIENIALDIEAPRNTPFISILGIAASDRFGMSLRILAGKDPALSPNEELEIWEKLARLLTIKGVIAHNLTYDAGVLWHKNHIMCRKMFADTLIAAHALWPEMQRDLGFLASKCLDVPPWKGKAREDSAYYNVCDAVNDYGIWNVLSKELVRTESWNTFEFEMLQLEAALFLQLQGIRIDPVKQQELLKAAGDKRDNFDEQLANKIGYRINYRSPKQLQKLLYIDLGLPVQYKRRKSASDPRVVSADSSALLRLAMLVPDNPVFNMLISYKKQDKLIRSFLDITPSPDGHVHSSYNVTGATETEEETEAEKKGKKRGFGRWSSSKSIIIPYGSGNLQNIPPEARKMYVPEPGHVLLMADYVQAEAVVVSYLINDFKMIDIFKKSFGLKGDARKPYDIHRMTASDMFGIPLLEVTKDQRDIGKTIRHACVDDKTEVLTDTGWKLYEQLNKNVDMVAQWDMNGTISYRYPKELFRFPYEGEMLHFEGIYIDQLVTEEHRIPVINRKTMKVLTISGRNLFDKRNGDFRIPVAGLADPCYGFSITPLQARFLTAVQADGSCRERGNKREFSFNLIKPRKIERLIDILTNLDIEFSTYPYAENGVSFYINGNRQKKLFDFIMLTNKKFGSWVLNLQQDAMNALVEESMWWDSRRNLDNTSWQYYSQYKENCEWMQTMAHLTGRRATVYDGHPTVFTTNISESNYADASKLKRYSVPYKGFIYSMSIDSMYYLIKRNGKISITGNSNYSMGPTVLAIKLGLPKLILAKNLFELYHSKCPQLRLWHIQIQNELRQGMTLTNLIGRKHRFHGFWGDELFRSAYSYKPQSTVGDMLNESISQAYRLGLRILLQLHDAMYILCRHDEVVDAAYQMYKIMTARTLEANHQEFKLDVDYKLGNSWGEMEDYIP